MSCCLTLMGSLLNRHGQRKNRARWGTIGSVELFTHFQRKSVSGEEVCDAAAHTASLYGVFLRTPWTGITFNQQLIFSFLPDLDHDLWFRLGRWTWGPQGKYQPDSAYFQLFLLGASFGCLQGVTCLDLSEHRTVQHPRCKHTALHWDLPLTPSPAKELSPSLLFWLPGLLSWTHREYFPARGRVSISVSSWESKAALEGEGCHLLWCMRGAASLLVGMHRGT